MPWTTKLNNLTKKHFNLQINDLVLVKQLPKNKFCTHFSSHTYQITEQDVRMTKVEMGLHTIPLLEITLILICCQKMLKLLNKTLTLIRKRNKNK